MWGYRNKKIGIESIRCIYDFIKETKLRKIKMNLRR
jgi:hypothetical protein